METHRELDLPPISRRVALGALAAAASMPPPCKEVLPWRPRSRLLGSVPLLVMDMYEHAYHIDYGANARGYLDAFFANLRFAEVDQRLESAARARSGKGAGA